MFSNQDDELPPWSIKRQKAYKISRFVWIAQAVIALLAAGGILIFIMRM
jgi:hypothetical protein